MNGLVIKVGGRVGRPEGALADLPAILAPDTGGRERRVCLVHGGGPEVSRWMERLALPVRFKNGLRVTDEAALEVAIMVLRGGVNTALVRNLAALGVRAVGLSGLDGGLVRARPHADPELGAVGEVDLVQPDLLQGVLALGMVPVVAPIALDGGGNARNVNADTLCGAIAGALEADLTIFLTDVPGVLDRDRRLLPRLTAGEVEAMIVDGSIHGGMIPKVRACLAALDRGARAVCIADGRAAGILPALVAGVPEAGTIIER